MRPYITVPLAALSIWATAHFWPGGAIIHPPGVLVLEAPLQTNCVPHSLGMFKGYALSAVASYELRALVLHTKHYWAEGRDLVPYDVALGWGQMSDQTVLARLTISQSNRFYFYEWQDVPPIPEKEITIQSSNNHVIAANSAVAHVISSLRRGQIVSMKGWLVNVTGQDGFHWETSVRRDDTGNGACEVFYVESAAAADEPGQLAPLAPAAARY